MSSSLMLSANLTVAACLGAARGTTHVRPGSLMRTPGLGIAALPILQVRRPRPRSLGNPTVTGLAGDPLLLGSR